ncbi:hypothetical protein niasHT_029263 [Heterodera trifolii]|uniref:Uncharacterized protein n=1 Tax=Heterodera trifolii TaxID=157864 RepID=A0ABD2JKS3_9BILA
MRTSPVACPYRTDAQKSGRFQRNGHQLLGPRCDGISPPFSPSVHSLWQLCIKTNCDRLLEFILRNIPSIAGVHDNSSSSPSAAADDGQPLLIKWLCSSRPGEADLPPKLFSFPTNDAWRVLLLRPISSPYFAKKLTSSCVPQTYSRTENIPNESTGEQLTCGMELWGSVSADPFCPIARDQKKWDKWLVEAVDDWHLDDKRRWRKFEDMRNRVVVSICDVRAIGDGLDDNQAAATFPGPSGHQQQQ